MRAFLVQLASCCFLVSLTSGCRTPYQSESLRGGYSETRLQENVFTVSFRGNGYTRPERTTDFAMLRCAELTIQNGYRFFVIADAQHDASSSVYSTPGSSSTTGTLTSVGSVTYGSFRTSTNPGSTVSVVRHRSSYVISCFKEKPDGVLSFDATFLANSIRQKYGMRQSPAP